MSPWHMWVVCCNIAWSYRRGILGFDVPRIWCSMPGQVKDTMQGKMCNCCARGLPIWGELLRYLSAHTPFLQYTPKEQNANVS